MYILVAITAIMIFIILKNKGAKRQIDRRNKLQKKKEELIEKIQSDIKQQSDTKLEKNTNNEN